MDDHDPGQGGGPAALRPAPDPSQEGVASGSAVPQEPQGAAAPPPCPCDAAPAEPPPATGSERRLHPRHASTMLVRLPTERGARWHFVQDISLGGLAFQAPQPVPNEHPIAIELADPETGETYCCLGRVAWYDYESSRAGVAFLQADDRLGARLLPACGCPAAQTGE